MRAVYDRQAQFFDSNRDKRLIMEGSWLARLSATMPAAGSVLDLGCGAGEPIARHFIEAGHELTGLDFSPVMLEIARGRFPQATWIEADMRAFDLGRRFDAIIGWDSFFHLTPEGQRQAMGAISRHLNAGANVLLTVGDIDGEVLGAVGADPVYHSSFSPDGYRALFAEEGMEVTDLVLDDRTAGGRNILMASKTDQKMKMPDEARARAGQLLQTMRLGDAQTRARNRLTRPATSSHCVSPSLRS
jgi:SAM-dependent methyltransferase